MADKPPQYARPKSYPGTRVIRYDATERVLRQVAFDAVPEYQAFVDQAPLESLAFATMGEDVYDLLVNPSPRLQRRSMLLPSRLLIHSLFERLFAAPEFAAFHLQMNELVRKGPEGMAATAAAISIPLTRELWDRLSDLEKMVITSMALIEHEIIQVRQDLGFDPEDGLASPRQLLADVRRELREAQARLESEGLPTSDGRTASPGPPDASDAPDPATTPQPDQSRAGQPGGDQPPSHAPTAASPPDPERQQLGEDLRDLAEACRELGDAREALGDPRAQATRQLANLAGDLSRLSDRLPPDPPAPPPGEREATNRALNDIRKEMEQRAEALQALLPPRTRTRGTRDPMPWYTLDADAVARIGALLRANSQLGQILRVSGRIERLQERGGRSTVDSAAGAVYGVDRGRDLARLAPDALTDLAHPTLRARFMAEFAHGALPVSRERSLRPAGKGPIVIAIDASGSMRAVTGNLEGQPVTREIWAKGLALAVARRAEGEGRLVHLMQFSGTTSSLVQLTLDPKSKQGVGERGEQLLQFLVRFKSGGTVFRTWMDPALELMERTASLRRPGLSSGARASGRAWGRADIICISDGAGEKFQRSELDAWSRMRRAGTRVRSIRIAEAAPRAADTLDQISDQVFVALDGEIQGLGSATERAITRALFDDEGSDGPTRLGGPS